MSGLHREMISPSVWRMKRITPWVLGCCGPMLSSISCVCSVAMAPLVPLPLEVVVPGVVDAAVVRREDVVLAQRVPLPVLREQQAAEIGMAVEADAEEIEGLALEPVRPAPDRGHGLRRRLRLRHFHLEHGAVAERIRVQ